MSRKIRILYTIPNFDTAGSGKAMLKIAKMLPDDLEPIIACEHSRGAFFNVVKDSGIPVHVLQVTQPIKPRLTLPFRVSPFRKLLINERIDLVHSFHYSNDYSEGLAARLAGVPWVFTKKNMGWGDNAWKLRSWMAKHIICQNTDMLKKFYPGSSKTTLIPRGVDIKEFCPRPPAVELFDEFKLSHNTFVVLAVANLVPVKGIEYLIDAFDQIYTEFQNAALMIVGDDREKYAQELKDRASLKASSKAIIFTGKRLDVKDFQSIATVFVLPTLNKGRQEGSPVSLLEAMAAGTPVIASDVAGIRDQLAPFPDQLFQPGNAETLSEKLLNILRLTPADRKQIGQQQIDRVLQEYTLEKEVERHVSVYRKILHK